MTFGRGNFVKRIFSRAACVLFGGYSGALCAASLAADAEFTPYSHLSATTKPASVPTGCAEFEVERPRPQGERTVKAADFGFSPESDDNAAAINRALAECRRIGAGRLDLAPGFYNCFGKEGITLGCQQDLMLDGKGAVLIFRRPPRVGTNDKQFDIPVAGANMVFSNCVRVAVRDMKLDWDWDRDPLADFATLEAVHVDDAPNASYVDFRMCDHARHPRYPEPVPIQTIGGMTADHTDRRTDAPFSGFYGTSEGHFGTKNEWLAPNVLRVWPSVKLEGRRYQALYDARFSAAFNAEAVKRAAKDVGGTYRIAHCYYGPNAINTYGCRHLTLERVDIWSAYGMGVRTSGRQKYWQFVDCHIRLPPPDLKRPDGRAYAPYRRGVTVTADAHHVVQSQGFVKFVGCSWTLHQDDTHNFHDRSTLAITAAPRRLEVVNGRGADYFGAAAGDELELAEDDFSRVGWKGRIVAVEGDTYVVDRDLPKPKGIAFVVFNASYGTDNILLRDCEMVNTLQARNLVHGCNVTVEGCRFRNITGAPLRFQAEYTWNAWCEGFGCTNVVVRGCTFDNDFNGYTVDGLSAEIYAGARVAPPVEQWIRIGNRYVADALAARKAAKAPDPVPCRDIVSGLLVEKCRFRNPRGYVLQIASGRNMIFRNSEIEFERPPYRLLPSAGCVSVKNADHVHVSGIRVTTSAGTVAPPSGVYAEPRLPRP